MSTNLPEKKYFTFQEMREQLQCDESYLRYFVIEGYISPSLLLPHDSYPIYVLQLHEDGEGEAFLAPSEAVDSSDELIKEFLYGFHFLVRGGRNSWKNCNFEFVSKISNGYEEGHVFYKLKKAYEMEDVLENCVFMADEVERFKALKGSMEKPIESRERTTYLNIIGALLELIKSPRPGRGTDAAVIEELLLNYSDRAGISKSTLENKFPQAKRSLLARVC